MSTSWDLGGTKFRENRTSINILTNLTLGVILKKLVTLSSVGITREELVIVTLEGTVGLKGEKRIEKMKKGM